MNEIRRLYDRIALAPARTARTWARHALAPLAHPPPDPSPNQPLPHPSRTRTLTVKPPAVVLDPRRREIRVDEQLRSQLDRLEQVAQLNSSPVHPHEWRLGSDPCFLKLAYWPEDISKKPVEGLARGMYLPVSYVRMLLENDCTLGPQKGSQARLLGYDRVERHLVGAQFVELVKEGLVGTIGTTREQLWSMIKRRVSAGHNVLIAEEHSTESVRDRQNRNRTRTSKDNSYVHKVYRQESLFGPDSER